MRSILPIIALTLGLTTASAAQAGPVQYGNDLQFVAETQIPGTDGNMALCHLTDFATFFFVPVYTIIEGYAVSNDGCTGSMYRELPAENFAALQAAGLISADIPATPTVGLQQLAWNYAWVIFIGMALAFKVLGAVMGRGGRRTKTAAPDTLAIHSLVAMSQVAVADGRIDQAEIKQISIILTRLTGTAYSTEKVNELLSRLNPSASDLAQVGQDLSDADRQIVLEAALNIAVADGEIHPSEYAVVSDLAQRMAIGAEQFRGALHRISAHLNTIQSA